MPRTALANSPAFSIREMQRSDIPAVCALANAIWYEHYTSMISKAQIEYMLDKFGSEQVIQKEIEEEGHRYWVAESDGRLVGYVAVHPTRNSDNWHIHKLYVDRACQGQGTGRKLVECVQEQCRPKILTLRVNRLNYTAINFYFRIGFSILKLDTKDIGEGFLMEDFIMKRAL